MVTLPEFFRLGREGEKPRWLVAAATDLPAELGMTQYRFETPKEDPQDPRATPDAPESSWKKPGPAAGPFQARLGDGSVVTYAWYRFADQPAMQDADLTREEREIVQQRVEKLHLAWTKDRNYLAPPDVGTLARGASQFLADPRGRATRSCRAAERHGATTGRRVLESAAGPCRFRRRKRVGSERKAAGAWRTPRRALGYSRPGSQCPADLRSRTPKACRKLRCAPCESGPGFDLNAAARPGSRLRPHRYAAGTGRCRE